MCLDAASMGPGVFRLACHVPGIALYCGVLPVRGSHGFGTAVDGSIAKGMYLVRTMQLDLRGVLVRVRPNRLALDRVGARTSSTDGRGCRSGLGSDSSCLY